MTKFKRSTVPVGETGSLTGTSYRLPTLNTRCVLVLGALAAILVLCSSAILGYFKYKELDRDVEQRAEMFAMLTTGGFVTGTMNTIIPDISSSAK